MERVEDESLRLGSPDLADIFVGSETVGVFGTVSIFLGWTVIGWFLAFIW
jgi:hypothetical protein